MAMTMEWSARWTLEHHRLLETANAGFGLQTSTNSTVVFVYSAPKVGSTSIVSSLRIFCSHFMDVVHVHDDEMARRLVPMVSEDGTVSITVMDLIYYNAWRGKKVVVLDVYRTPMERKMSQFFEELATFHFNVPDETIEKYAVERILRRFFNVFPHIANEDCFMERYGIPTELLPEQFVGGGLVTPVALSVMYNGVRFVKLRLQDAHRWSDFLSELFVCPLKLVEDNQTENKRAGFAELYRAFKREVCIPLAWWREYIENDRYFQYYMSEAEKQVYRQKWVGQVVEDEGFFELFSAFSAEEYAVYYRVSCENMSRPNIQGDHYLDEGCRCVACGVLRMKTATLIERGEPLTERITHDVSKREWIQRRVDALKESVAAATASSTAAAPPTAVSLLRRPMLITMSKSGK